MYNYKREIYIKAIDILDYREYTVIEILDNRE